MFPFNYSSPSKLKEQFDLDPQTLEQIIPHLTEGVHYVRTPGGHLRVCVEMFADWLINQQAPDTHITAIERFRASLPSTQSPSSKGHRKSGGGVK